MAKPSVLFEKLLKKRGLKTEKQIEAFLSPDYGNLYDPMLLPDMKVAVDRLKTALENGEKIMIFGDYDADGVTATAVLYLGLKQMGFGEIAISLPNRVKDGYGISRKAVAKMKKEKASLAITVDCGSRDHEVISELKEAGFDTIITDHHETLDTLPDAVAVINPKREDSKYPFSNLAGVAVAFKLVQALQSGLKVKSFPAGQEKWLLDLVAIGTVCDCMELVGENRILAHYGFKVISKTRLRGLRALMNSGFVRGGDVGSYLVGFVIGPRINAAGRLDDPLNALKVFISDKAPDVASAVQNLEKLNEDRKKLQEKGLKLAEKQIKGELPSVVVVKVPNMHEGIIGIVAGRLVDKVKRPVWVFTECEDGYWKGSGRSFGDYDLAESIKKAEGIYERGGGHKEAAGLTVKNEKKLDEFIKCANNLYKEKKLDSKEQEKCLLPLADLSIKNLKELSYQFARELGQLEPFGNGNQQPIFELVNMIIAGKKRIKEKYLSLTVSDGETEISLMSFNPNENWFDLENGSRVDLKINLEANEWRGIKSARGVILDLEIKEY